MAKTSAVEKNRNRRMLVRQYAAKRAELRAVTRDRKREPEERFEATLALADVVRAMHSVRSCRVEPAT
jgi:small subunit ribosomal protein S14